MKPATGQSHPPVPTGIMDGPPTFPGGRPRRAATMTRALPTNENTNE